MWTIPVALVYIHGVRAADVEPHQRGTRVPLVLSTVPSGNSESPHCVQTGKITLKEQEMGESE